MNQATSRTAIAATVSAELRGIRGANQADWFQEQLEINVGDRGRKDALQRRKARSPWDERRGRKPDVEGEEEPAPKADDWLWDSVEVDPFKLDLQQALVLFPALQQSDSVVSHLKSTIGVVRIFETYGALSGGLVVAHLVYMGAQRRGQLDARLRELQIPFEWLELRTVVPQRPFELAPAAATWAAIAGQLADVEELRLTPVER